MKVKIGKEFHWEMSHRLPFHDGGCQNIHGHSYKMLVELIGTTDKNGMVLDFYDMTTIISPFINKLDHAFICNEGDINVIEFLKNNNFKYFVMPLNTTCEHLSFYLANEFATSFKKFDNLDSLTVRIYETIDAFAEVTINLK